MLTLFVLLLVGSLLCLIFELVRQNRTNSVQENDQYTTFLQLPTSRQSSIQPRLAFERDNKPALVLPDLSGNGLNPVSVKSSSTVGVSYTVSLGDYRCTCPDWQELRMGFPANDCRRACKHVIQVLISSGYLSSLDDYSRAYLLQLRSGVPTDAQFVRANLPEQSAIFVYRKGHVWIDVITLDARKRRNPIQRFGYNPTEGRWSYGKAPKNAKVMRQVIMEIGADRVAASGTWMRYLIVDRMLVIYG